MTRQFSPEVTKALADPEGTFVFRYTLDAPLTGPPDNAIALLETAPNSGVTARLEVDKQMHLSFLRATDEGARIVRVDLRPLIGGRVLQIYLVWGPDALRIHIGARDINTELLTASSEA
jgi:hypothetical protein